MSRAFRIASEMSEKQIEADVSNFFGHYSSHFGSFRLLDVDEQLTGADKQMNWRTVAYFFQFKRPIGLTPLTTVPRKQSKQPLMRVRVFRHQNLLDQHPYSVCFELRDRRDSGTPFQHNVLLRYEQPPISRAIYVCPLSLTEADYVRSMRDDAHDFDFPFWDWRHQWVLHGEYVARAAERSPFLRGHVSIVPHEEVSSAAHHYSFSKQGTDVAFHQPRLLQARPSRLSDFVAKEIRRFAANPELMVSVDHLATTLFEAAQGWSDGALANPGEQEDKIAWLEGHGRLLSSVHGIRQMVALVGNETENEAEARSGAGK